MSAVTSFTKQQSGFMTAHKSTARRSAVTTRALFTKTRPAEPVVEEKPKKAGFSFFSAKPKTTTTTTKKTDKATEYKRKESALSALDFSAARSRKDAELLYDARYGDLKDGKMTREQYMALRRKIGGTYKDFFKTNIDVKGKYTDKGYVSEEETNVPALPFLVITIISLFGTLGYVVSATSQ